MQWITRARPKIDRVACPWLITRFIDDEAEFLFAPPDQVLAIAQERGAIPFDVDGAELSHEGDQCSFDALIKRYALSSPALDELAAIVRAADTDRLDLRAQAAGLLAISLGLSRLCMHDDHRMLSHGFIMYDALYEWLLHGREERHGWNPGRVGGTDEPSWDRIDSGGVSLQISSRQVTVNGRPVTLPPKEFALLLTLMARRGRALTRQFLLQHVWSYQKDVTSRTVDWHVAALRRALGSSAAALRSIRAVGYAWDPAEPE